MPIYGQSALKGIAADLETQSLTGSYWRQLVGLRRKFISARELGRDGPERGTYVRLAYDVWELQEGPYQPDARARVPKVLRWLARRVGVAGELQRRPPYPFCYRAFISAQPERNREAIRCLLIASPRHSVVSFLIFWVLPVSARTEPCPTFSKSARFLTSDSASPTPAICARGVQEPLDDCRAGRIHKIRETVHP